MDRQMFSYISFPSAFTRAGTESSALCYACWPVRFRRPLQPVGGSQPFAQGWPGCYDFLEVCFHVLVEAAVAAPWRVRVPLQPVRVPCVSSMLPDRAPTLRCKAA